MVKELCYKSECRWFDPSVLAVVEREGFAEIQSQLEYSEWKELTVRSVVYLIVSVSAEKQSRNKGIMSERQKTVVCSFDP